MRGVLANRLVIAVAAVAVTLSAALGAFVVLPVNAIVDRDHVDDTAARAALAAVALRAGGAIADPTVRVVASSVDDPAVSAVDRANARDPHYGRAAGSGHMAVAVRAVGDGRLVVVRVDRGGAIERQERIGLTVALAVVLAGTMGWAIWAGGAYARRLGRVTRVAGLVADGDFSARAAIPGRDEVGRLGAAVDRMAARLGALERARSEFVGKVSHDLRTPLTVIKGYAYTLERRADDPDSRRRLEAIGRETDRLAALVDDLLTLSQAGAGALRVTIAPVEVAPLLDEVCERVGTLAGERGVVVSSACDEGVAVDGDRRRLAQILTNLATNALRHTPAGGSVTLAAEVDASGVGLVVTDTGCGIDPAGIERLLRPFEHGSGESAGSGLGLTIVTELVGAHGGTFALTPRPGGGTIARVLLPSRRPAPSLAGSVG